MILNKVWNKVPVSQIADILLGGTPKTKMEEYWGGDIPWASAKDISNNSGRYIYETEKLITKSGLDNSNTRLLPKDTIVITARGTVGKLAILSRDMCFNQSCYGLISKKEIDPLFLYYALEESLNQLQTLTYGTVFDTITIKTFDDLKIYFPDKTSQVAMSSILDFIDSLIELNHKMNEKLEKIAQVSFKSWFIDFEPFQDGKFVESELGKIPKGWEVNKFGDAIKLFDSKRIPLSKREREKRKGLFPYYGATSIMDYIDDFLFDGIFLLVAEDGSVMDGNERPVLQYVHGKFWVNNHAHVIQGKDEMFTEFLYLFLKQINVKPYVSGAVQPKINQGNLKRIPIIKPPKKVLDNFRALISSIYDKIRLNEDEINTLIKLRDFLLPQLISGRLRIKNPEKFMEEISN